MKRMTWLVVFIVVAGAAGAQPLGHLAEVTLIDRASGLTLTPHEHSGEYWVAGQPGARYAVEVHNRLGERLLAVISVDGINVLSGQSAGWDQTGYVLGPWQDDAITGWRKSNTEVAAFTFTASARSYAARTGRPASIGVIGLAFFRERPLQAAVPEPFAGLPSGLNRSASPPPAGGPSGRVQPRKASPPPGAEALAAPSPVPELGTGHGERETSIVTPTSFDRLSAQPDEIVRIRYDSLAHLIAMGILPVPTPDPFPASPSGAYVPDPPPE